MSTLALLLGLVFVYTVYLSHGSVKKHRKLSHIPAVGFNSWLGSFISSIDHLFRSRRYMEMGYKQYKDRPYKVPAAGDWFVVVNGELMEEMVGMSDLDASPAGAIHEMTRADYTLGTATFFNPYHIPLVNQLSKQLHELYPALHHEINSALSEYIQVSRNDEWTPISLPRTMIYVIAHAANTALGGTVLSRNKDFIRLCVDHSYEVLKVAVLLNLAPEFARPFIAKRFSNINVMVRKATAHLYRAIPEDNSSQKLEAGFLKSFVEGAPANEAETTGLARRYLAIVFAALHTSTVTLNHALYHLAAHPEYAEILHKEIKPLVANHGWTYESLESMHHLDSFLKESLRLTGVTWMPLQRRAMRDFTFSDGTFIPEGTLLVGTDVAHFDPDIYPDPHIFQPWRFVSSSATGGPIPATQAGPAFLSFGRRKHVCPGRYLAVANIKTIMAHIVLDYDIRFADGKRPQNSVYVTQSLPNLRTKVLFRRHTACA